LDQSNQTGNPIFNETITGGVYLPAGQSPTFGSTRRNPTTGNSSVISVAGTGASFVSGNSWTVSMDYQFEGLDQAQPGSNVFLPSLGLSTSNSTVSNQLLFGMQKVTSQTTAYQLFVNAPGGGFYTTNIQYSDIGDAAGDANDLTDNLRMEFQVTKSATANEFNFVATLSNLDTAFSASITNTLTQSAAYSTDLYGYFTTGAQAESGNFDLFNAEAFEFSAIPEPSSMVLVFLGFALSALGFKRT
jgi:hypothetical protein